MNRGEVLFAISSALVATRLFTAPFPLTRRGMRQNNFADNCREGGGVQQHQGVAARYQKTQARVDMLWWWGNKRDLREQIRSVSSRITPRISLKKEECQSWQLDIKVESSPQMFFFFSFYLKGRKMFLLPVGVKRKLAKARSTIAKKKKNKKERKKQNARG